MTPNLQNNVFSPQDLKVTVLEVRKYAHWFSQSLIKTKVAGGGYSNPPQISQAAAILINELAAQKPLSTEILDGFIASLEKLETTLPRITIILAAPAPASLKKTLVAWCRQNINPNILVEFRFNSTLLGGMVIRYGSRVDDWSFRRQILAARGRFPEVLRRV
jgi:hypothetical protein